MTILPPIIPEQETPPQDFPFVMPTPGIPESPDIRPANIDPLTGNAPPLWGDYRPIAVREGRVCYALFPSEIRFYVTVVGAASSDTPPDCDLRHSEYTAQFLRSDGTIGTDANDVHHDFITPISLESYSEAGWTARTTFPANFPQPNVFPFVWLTPAQRNYEFALLSRGAERFVPDPGYWRGVSWGLWDLWRPENYLQDMQWGSFDVYVMYQTFVTFVLMELRPSLPLAAFIPNVMSSLGFLSLLFSGGDSTLQSLAQRRRLRRVKKDVR